MKEIGVSKITWKLEFWKLNLKMGILKIKFERNWNFENYLRIEILRIKFGRLEFWKLFENWNFGKLFENGDFENWNFEN